MHYSLLQFYLSIVNEAALAITALLIPPKVAAMQSKELKTTNDLTVAPSPHVLDLLPQRLELLLERALQPNEEIILKLKGASKEALVCTSHRVMILKCGFMTGNFFGRKRFLFAV